MNATLSFQPSSAGSSALYKWMLPMPGRGCEDAVRLAMREEPAYLVAETIRAYTGEAQTVRQHKGFD